MAHQPRHGRARRRGDGGRLWAAASAGGLGVLSAVRQAVLAGAAGLLLWSVAPAALGWTTTVVVSGSMAPAVRTGDIVAASPVGEREARRLAPGTVVLVDDPARPGSLLLHRLVRLNEDGHLVTKGDANAVPDSTPVPADHVRGLARLRIPALGLPVVWARHGEYLPAGALAVLGLTVVFWRPGSGGPGAHRRRPSISIS